MVFSLQAQPRPNIILAMADDMGWGDPGYNSMTVTYADGTPHPDQGWIQTPTLDTMAANGIRFDRFYSAAAVCSPTRASCLTGRNPYRVGVPYANSGKLGFDETPLSEVLSSIGYRTGHFGKWHLGSMTTLRSDSNRGGNASVYSAPWHHSYDVCFATESKVPTYHPYRKASNSAPLPTSFSDPNFYGTRYWRIPATWDYSSGEGEVVPVEEVNNAADGDDSKLMVEQAIPFIQDAVSQGKPFFVVLWFHTPHKPVTDPDGVSGVDSSDAARDSIEDMDAALGMLRDELETLGVRGDTMFWVTSDNGPENGVDSFNETSTTRSIRSGRLLERKRSLHEGGVRVPGILEWPNAIASGFSTDMPVVTSDYYSTILDLLEISVPGQKPLDGVSLRPLIENQTMTRTKPIGFKTPDNNAKSWMGEQYKLIDAGSGWELYDLVNIAPGEEVEQTPVATAANVGSQPQAIQDVYNTMLAEYTAWDNTLGGDTPYVHASQPTVTLSTPLTTVNDPFTVTATFSEAVSQLNANEFAVTNGTASGLTGSGTTWSVTIAPASDGAVTVHLPAGAVIDADGNVNASSNELEVTYTNTSAPLVTLNTPDDPVSASFEVTATFNEDVTGLESTDFDVTNGSASGLAGGPRHLHRNRHAFRVGHGVGLSAGGCRSGWGVQRQQRLQHLGGDLHTAIRPISAFRDPYGPIGDHRRLHG
jgi:arylsulfatase A-like enzyme